MRFALIFLLTLTSPLLASYSDYNIQEVESFHCSLNKSQALYIYEIYERGVLTTARLEKVLFNGEITDSIVLRDPKIINYGDSYVIVADHGRGGFISINIVRDESYQTGHAGYLNFNLYQTKFYTPGVLTTWCHRPTTLTKFQF